MTIVQPYLIQRANIKRPLNEHKGDRLSQAISFDYMGSAEFEFGAIPNAFRDAREHFPNYKESKILSIKEGESVLRVFHCMSDEEFGEYAKILEKLRADEYSIRTKESVGLDPKSYHNKKLEPTDFWWDIDNNALWSFDKEFMKRLPDHLKASFDFLAAGK